MSVIEYAGGTVYHRPRIRTDGRREFVFRNVTACGYFGSAHFSNAPSRDRRLCKNCARVGGKLEVAPAEWVAPGWATTQTDAKNLGSVANREGSMNGWVRKEFDGEAKGRIAVREYEDHILVYYPRQRAEADVFQAIQLHEYRVGTGAFTMPLAVWGPLSGGEIIRIDRETGMNERVAS